MLEEGMAAELAPGAAETPGYAAGGHDWLAVWRQMYAAERAQAESVTTAAFQQTADHWAGRANRFAALSQREQQPDESMRWLLPHLRREDTVLDIGAGTGRYLPVLAGRVARVIAVEPSPAMREQMHQHIAAEGLQNVEVLAEGWPLAQPIQADVAFSAHALYGVREIGPFLQAMHAAARRLCVLFLMIRHRNVLFSPFWQRFHGQPRLPLPGALEACNALFQLGYPAELRLVRRSYTGYADADEALQDIRHKLRLVPDPARDAELAAAIAELLVGAPDGSLLPPGMPRHAAIIWWHSGPDTHGV